MLLSAAAPALVAACAAAAYLVGTFPTAHLVARAAGVDVTGSGSGNPGASNVARLLGWRAGAVVFLVDAAKGAVGAAAGTALAGRAGGYLCGAAAVLGHVFPATRRFRGGRGVASGAGMLAVLHPLVASVLAVVWILLGVVGRRASVASLVAAVAAPVLVGVSGRHPLEVAGVAVLALLVVARHAANVRRLLAGEELRLDRGRDTPDAGGENPGPGAGSGSSPS